MKHNNRALFSFQLSPVSAFFSLPPTPLPDERNNREWSSLVRVVVAAGILGTGLLTWSSFHQTSKDHVNRELPTADLVLTAVRRKLGSTESALMALAGLRLASGEVTLAELQRFVGSVERDGRSLEGIGTLGYAAAEPGKAPIRVIAPLDPGNKHLLGSDLWQLFRSPAAQALRPDATAPPESQLLPGRPVPGKPPFLVQTLPFGSSTDTASDKPKPPTLWAFATLPLPDVLRAALNHPLIQLREPVDLQLYLGDRATPAQLLYDSRNLAQDGVLPHAQARPFESGGQRWLLLVQAPLATPSLRLPPWVGVLLLGLTTTLLAALLTRQLLRRSQLAERGERSMEAMRRSWEASLQLFGIHRLAFSLIREGVVITDSDGSILSCNEAYAAISGYAEEELVGRNPRFMSAGHRSPAFYAALWEQLLGSGHWEGEVLNRRPSGELYPAWLRMGVVRDASGAPSHFVAAMADLTHLREKDQQLADQGYHDPLTQLPNLQKAELHLAEMCQGPQPLVMIWIELDGIKRIEESFGQAKGDRLVQVVVDRLGRFLGPTDFLAKVGRSEFLIVQTLEPSDPTGLQRASRILAGITDPMGTTPKLELALSAWAGLSCFPKDSREPESLLLFASTALGQARRKGPQSILHYSAEMTVRSRHRLALEAHLQRAVESGQLELQYQPQVDGQGNLLGAEALLRWRSPKFGLVSPLEFLPIAEASDLIHRIGEWVLQDACRQWQVWLQAGFDPGRLAVNLSNRQFQDPSQTVAKLVEACLRRTGLGVARLELEITESCLMSPIGAREQLLELEAMGVELAIDDFGTGFSSLSTIHTYPIRKLKIDRSFVTGVDVNPTSQAIVRATLAMAVGLGVSTLAEGVERPEELDFLRGCGCGAFQGYLFSRPLAAEAFEALLRKRTAAVPVPGGEPAKVHRP